MREEEAAILHGKILGFSGAEPKSARLWHNGTTARLAGVRCWQKNVLWDLGREILLGTDSWRFGILVSFCISKVALQFEVHRRGGRVVKALGVLAYEENRMKVVCSGTEFTLQDIPALFFLPPFSCSSLLQLRRTVPRCLIIPAGKIVNYFLLWITCIPGRTGSCLIFLASYHLPTEGNVAGTCPGRSVEPAVKSLQGRDSSPFQE